MCNEEKHFTIKATMCPRINRYVNYVPIAKVKGWKGWNDEPGTIEG